MEHLDGRRPPHARERSVTAMRERREGLRRAELMVWLTSGFPPRASPRRSGSGPQRRRRFRRSLVPRSTRTTCSRRAARCERRRSDGRRWRRARSWCWSGRTADWHRTAGRRRTGEGGGTGVAGPAGTVCADRVGVPDSGGRPGRVLCFGRGGSASLQRRRHGVGCARRRGPAVATGCRSVGGAPPRRRDVPLSEAGDRGVDRVTGQATERVPTSEILERTPQSEGRESEEWCA
jgi:hypothetical protein